MISSNRREICSMFLPAYRLASFGNLRHQVRRRKSKSTEMLRISILSGVKELIDYNIDREKNLP